jgi:hypothetical protein
MYRRTLYRRAIPWGLAVAAMASPFAARAATDEAYMCRNGERERRVELQHPDIQGRLPCQVVYWRDATQTGGSESLWEAAHDYGYCIEQTRGLVQHLQDGGWRCQKTSPAQAQAQTQGQTQGQTQAQIQTIPALAPSRLPAASDAERAELGDALARDMQRLAKLTTTGHFEIEGAELGDLDHDGNPDAAVLLNYQADHSASSQFLMAYRFEGNAFYPTAKTQVGGAAKDAVASRIERIQDGAIELLLEVRQRGDLECCPSGRRRETYVLKDGALVARPPEG